MEYAALFAWITLCLLLGAAMHHALGAALGNRVMRALAAPGVVVRKLSMAAVALTCGATLTRANVYDLCSRDVELNADGLSSVAKVAACLAPLFGCAIVFAFLNAALGSPLSNGHGPPEMASVDFAGLQGFLDATWGITVRTVRQAAGASWRDVRVYIALVLGFSMALGAGAPMGRARQAIVGAGLLALGLAVLCGLIVGRTFIGTGRTLAWSGELRESVLRVSATAFAMMIYGAGVAVLVGIVSRVYDLLAGSNGSGSSGRARRLNRDGSMSDAA